MRKLTLLIAIILLTAGCNKISEEEDLQRYYNNKANRIKQQKKYQNAMDGFFQLLPDKQKDYPPLLSPNKQIEPDLTTSIPKTNIITAFPEANLSKSLPTQTPAKIPLKTGITTNIPTHNTATIMPTHSTTTSPLKTSVTTSFPKTNAPLSTPTLDRRRRQDF